MNRISINKKEMLSYIYVVILLMHSQSVTSYRTHSSQHGRSTRDISTKQTNSTCGNNAMNSSSHSSTQSINYFVNHTWLDHMHQPSQSPPSELVLGYLTSLFGQKGLYRMPNQWRGTLISGAITYAVETVNRDKTLLPNTTLR